MADKIECPKCGNRFDLNGHRTVQCVQCGAKWIPRKADPVQCPRCKRVDWKEQNHANSNV